MVNTISFLTFFFLLFLGACQVKETASNGGLISGHTPTTNKFTVTPPLSKVYVEGEVLKFRLSFPFDIQSDFSGGEPILKIKLAGQVKDALFKEAPTPKELSFEYVIANNDNAPTGIEVTSLALNGALLQFLKEEALVNCDVTSVKPTLHAQVKVDTEKPYVTKAILSSAPGLYHAGDELLFSLTMSERVFVKGTPEFDFTLSGNNLSAKYLSGSGSTLLVFSYTVSDSDFDTNGFDSIGANILLPSSSIEDTVGNPIVTSLASVSAALKTQSSVYQVLGAVPHLIGVTLPPNGIYEVAKTLDFEFEFDRPVTVTGAPKYIITIGEGASKTTRDVSYISGDGTNKLIFSYVTIPGDVDLDGIEVPKSITQDGGDIRSSASARSFFSPATNNLFTPPSSKGIILKSLLPQAIAVTRNDDTTKKLTDNSVDNVWIIGQKLVFTVKFNTEILVNNTMGIPFLEFFISGVKKNAPYLSGGDGQTSLIFTYDIQEGDQDLSGNILIGNIVANGATITDKLNTIAKLELPAGSKLASTRIDGIRPTIKKINPPANKTYSQLVTGMTFGLDWSEEVYLPNATGLSLKIDIGGSDTLFPTTLINGTILSNFTQPNLTGKNDSNGVELRSPLVLTGKVFDVAGNEAQDLSFIPPATSNILVDTKKPTVIAATPITPDGVYKEGDEILVDITFDEVVEATLNGTNNYLAMAIGGVTTLRMTPTVTKTATTHTFKYTIKPGDNGVFKIGTSFAGSIYDLGRNTPNTFVPPSTPGILVDAVAPTITGSSGTLAAKTLVEGNTLEISLTFSEEVFVTGSPSITANFGGGENDFIYSSGTGTDTLKFQRIITENHFNMNGLPNNISTINLNGGKIVDQKDHPAPTTFAAKKIDLSGIKITFAEVRLWTRSDFTNLAVGGFPIANEGAISTETLGGGVYRIFNGDDNIRFTGPQSLSSHVLLALKAPNVNSDVEVMGQNIKLVYDSSNNYYEVIPASGTIVSGPSILNKSARGIIHTEQQIDFLSSEKVFGANFNGSVGEIIIIDDSIDPTKLSKVKNYLISKF